MLDVMRQMDEWTDMDQWENRCGIYVLMIPSRGIEHTPRFCSVLIPTGSNAVMLLHLALLGEGSVLSTHERIF